MKRSLLLLKKWLPPRLKIWLDTSNWPTLKKFSAKFGLLEPKHIDEMISDPAYPAICFCPLCAEAIKGDKNGQGVWLSHKDKTPLLPDVKIPRKQTLFVKFGGESFQVCCIKCATTHAEAPDRFGHINQEGELTSVSPKINGHKNGHRKTPPPQ